MRCRSQASTAPPCWPSASMRLVLWQVSASICGLRQRGPDVAPAAPGCWIRALARPGHRDASRRKQARIALAGLSPAASTFDSRLAESEAREQAELVGVEDEAYRPLAARS